LKEPVRKIKTFIGMLENELGAEITKEEKIYFTKVQNATNRMLDMIAGVLTYSTVNTPEQIIEKVNIKEIAGNIGTDLEILIQQKSATIECTSIPFIEGMPILIHQLFYNLINNALKFSKSDVPLIVTITSKPVAPHEFHINKLEGSIADYIQIEVTDNGIGFNQEYQEKIFKPFTRLYSKDQYEGTGLGLSLCRKIVERHGGSIPAQSKEGEGATFIIILPKVFSVKESMNLYPAVPAK
jgi:light-regulated signal transduction histidine kinase (bacteriophytochrome)